MTLNTLLTNRELPAALEQARAAPDRLNSSNVGLCAVLPRVWRDRDESVYVRTVRTRRGIGRMEMETLYVRYLVDGLPELGYVAGKSDWVDLYAAETVTLSAGDFRLIPLGVAIALPDGYEAQIVPRSSTFRNYGILQTNSMGVVDNSYRGDGDQWMFPAYATRNATIEKGARICQFRITRNQPALRFEAVEHLTAPDRGGFGSTGR